jgi:hypothetical protein
MEYLIGLILSLAVTGSATVIGFDRERAFYPTVLIVIASYYVLFAAMGASRRTLIIEIVVAGGFLLVAVLGFRTNFWLIVAALIGTAFLTSSIASSSTTPVYRTGGRVFAWHSMRFSVCS